MLGVLGTNQNTQSKIQNLAKLVGNLNAFEQAFNQSRMMTSPTRQSETSLQESTIGHPLNKFDVLLEASRRFCIGNREHIFEEEESIFFMEGPINPRNHHNTPEGCYSCGDRWKNTKDLENSHCTFCGNSNCKNCLKKSRNFQCKKMGDQCLSECSKEVKVRGTICKLCDRKFLIKEMVHKTLEEISFHNTALTTAISQQQSYLKEISETKEKHAEKTATSKHTLKKMKNDIKKLRDEIIELKTNYDDLQDEYESGRRKEMLIQEKQEELRKDIDGREETVSRLILRLKEDKERINEAENEAH